MSALARAERVFESMLLRHQAECRDMRALIEELRAQQAVEFTIEDLKKRSEVTIKEVSEATRRTKNAARCYLRNRGVKSIGEDGKANVFQRRDFDDFIAKAEQGVRKKVEVDVE